MEMGGAEARAEVVHILNFQQIERVVFGGQEFRGYGFHVQMGW